jgi:hypothetical protein
MSGLEGQSFRIFGAHTKRKVGLRFDMTSQVKRSAGGNEKILSGEFSYSRKYGLEFAEGLKETLEALDLMLRN